MYESMLGSNNNNKYYLYFPVNVLILSLSTQLKGLHNTLTCNIENTLDLIQPEITYTYIYVGQKRMNQGPKGIRQYGR